MAKQNLRDIFMKGIIDYKLILHINEIGSNLKEVLENKLIKNFEGKCHKEGYIKQNSIQLINYSSGIIKNQYVHFHCVAETLICLPIEGMLIDCVATNITKAGIKAEIKKYNPSPLIIFIARDHFYNDPNFLEINENDNITIRVIGHKYELNDTFISVIAELVNKNKKKQVKLVLDI